MVPRVAIRIGMVTVVATPIWLSAAMMPMPVMNQDALAASSRPYGRVASAVPAMSRAALAIALATTTMTIATAALGSQPTTPLIRSLTGFGPNTPNAICNVTSASA